MQSELTDAVVTTIKDAARQLRGQAKRAFQAKVAGDYLHGSARRAETVFGWGREAVGKGLEELEGSPGFGKATRTRGDAAGGRPKTEERLSELEADIRSLVDPQSQADPKFQSAFAYTRMTIEKAADWAETMTWKGVRPVVRLLDRVYRTGVRLTRAALRPYCEHLSRGASLPKWSVKIHPQPPTVQCDR